GERAHRARAVGRALERLVVQHHDDPVGGRVHVQLEPLGTRLEPRGEGVERVLGDHSGGAAVREEPRAGTVEVARRPTPSGTPAWGARRRARSRLRAGARAGASRPCAPDRRRAAPWRAYRLPCKSRFGLSTEPAPGTRRPGAALRPRGAGVKREACGSRPSTWARRGSAWR